MTLPSLAITADSPLDVLADVLVVGVRSSSDGARIVSELPELAALDSSLGAIGFAGGIDEVRRIPATAGAAPAFALVGLGPDDPTPDTLRYAAGTVARLVRGVDSLVFALPVESADDIVAVLEGAAIGAYDFTTYRSTTSPARRAPVSVTVAGAPRAGTTGEVGDTREIDTDEMVERAAVSATAVHTVRDLVNTPGRDLYPESFAAAATELVDGLGIDITVLADDELAAGSYGGIIGVGQGSTRGPRLVRIEWAPSDARTHLALVGKGITFDTGGLSLKPPASMVGMKYDMTGAATALAVVVAAARLHLPVRITGWLCLAENMPSGSAIRPGDVLTIRGGRTVEVLNTDAEGRLVLADGLVAASEEQPDAIVDIATLTGAASVAMGTRYVAAMGDTELAERVVAVGHRVGEPVWHMPLPAELRSMLDSDVADLANVKIGNTAGGMLIAGLFLREFVGTVDGDPASRIPWVHLDVAGAANNNGAGYGAIGKGPTGVAVRTLIELAVGLSRE